MIVFVGRAKPALVALHRLFSFWRSRRTAALAVNSGVLGSLERHVAPSRTFTRSATVLAALLLGFSYTAGTTRAAQTRGAIPAASAVPNPVFQSLFLKAAQQQKRGDYPAAAASYRAALALNPHLPEVRTNLGIMYHLMGQYAEAVRTFRLALGENPALFPANLFMGLDLLQLRQPAQAVEYFARALRLKPHDEQAALGMGKAYTALRRFEKANEFYERASLIDSGNSEALYGLGVTYLQLQNQAAAKLGNAGRRSPYKLRLLGAFLAQQGRANDAIHYYQSVPPRNVWTGYHAELGFEYLARDNVSLAGQEFRRELEHAPGSLLAQLGLARVLLEGGKPAACAAALQKVWASDRNFLRANAGRFWVGLTTEKSHEMEGALARQSHESPQGGSAALLAWSAATPVATPLSPPEAHPARGENPVAPVSAAELYGQGRYTACADRLKSEGAPHGRSSLLLLATCSYDSGDYRQAFTAAGSILKTAPADPAALYWRALASSRLAAPMLLAAGAAGPNSYRVHVLLGESYRQMEKIPDAEAEYRKAIALRPEREAAYLGLATVYWQQKDYDQALPQLRKALAASPHDPEASFLMASILVAHHQYSGAEPYAAAALRAEGRTVLYAHALLSKIDATKGDTHAAIKQIELALPADEDGSLHFQLYTLYKKEGQTSAAAAALRESRVIQRRQAETFTSVLERSQ